MYSSANDYFRKIFSQKVIKIPINGGFTCPNRDGSLSDKGCIFCSADGSGDFTQKGSIHTQFNKMKQIMNKKWKNGVYMPYFQAFTNTYAPIDELRQKYTEALSEPNVKALSVATRPDCINNDVIELFGELRCKFGVKIFVELGLQTSNEKTAKLINRCYNNDVYKRAVNMLKKADINVITHIILGLPYENKNDMIKSALFADNCGTDGLKLQLLHILKNTAVERLYFENKFNVLEFEEYVNIVVSIIEYINPNIVIHRITGDAKREDLIAPLWSLDKKKVLNAINKKLKYTYQGKYYKSLCGQKI